MADQSDSIYGPLNGVRAALVAGAVVAALIGAWLGWWIVTIVLGLAIAAHALLWRWMWDRAQQ